MASVSQAYTPDAVPSIRHSEKHAACSIVPVLPDAVVLHTISCTASAGTPLAARHPGRMCRCVHALAHHSYAADVYLCAQQDGRARAVQQSISKVPGVVPVDTAKCFDAGCHHHMLLSAVLPRSITWTKTGSIHAFVHQPALGYVLCTQLLPGADVSLLGEPGGVLTG